jgi:hypothetical protein
MNNAQYKQLAYEKAVLMAILRLAQDKYLPVEGMDEAEIKVECEDLPRSDCAVPEDAVIDVLLRLRKLAENVGKEMSNYKFVRTESPYDKSWQSERESKPSEEKPTAKGKQGKGKGGKGGPQAPAAK